jgi:hypothetical protein
MSQKHMRSRERGRILVHKAEVRLILQNVDAFLFCTLQFFAKLGSFRVSFAWRYLKCCIGEENPGLRYGTVLNAKG